MARPLLLFVGVAAALASAAPDGRATELTQVATALEEDNPWDLHLKVGFTYETRQALVKRELEGFGLDAAGGIPLARDLRYEQSRQLLDLRADLGIFHDVSLHVAAPLVLGDSRTLKLDDGISAANSTTVRDQLLPAAGLDAEDGAPGPGELFVGPRRHGLAYLGLGLDWAILDQAKDWTKPTWTVGVEGRLSIGEAMRFDRADPEGNRAVATGAHELGLSTAVSRRFPWAEPYVSFGYALPIPADGSPFEDLGRGQQNVRPQQLARTILGFEAILFDDAARRSRVSLDVRGRLEAHFEGRGYNELWEALAGAPGLGVDRDGDGVVDQPFPGVTDVESYATVAGAAALDAVVGDEFRFRMGAELAHDQEHFITFTDAGRDRDGNRQVDQLDEQNPFFQPVVDLVGRRYRVEGTGVVQLFVSATAMF